MPSRFWSHESFALVGHTARRGFPTLSYGALRKQGKKVFAIEPSVGEIEGDKAYPDFESLPEKVDAVVLEVPKEETEDWVRKAADAGVRNVWIHMTRDTPVAVALAKERGLNVLTGTCAIMYVKPGFHLPHVAQVGEPAHREVLNHPEAIPSGGRPTRGKPRKAEEHGADERTRTADLLITRSRGP